MLLKTFGRNPSGERLKKLMKSPNYKQRGFENLSVTPMLAEDASYFRMFVEFFSKGKDVTPLASLPSVKTDLGLPSPEPVITWFGHSSYLLKIAGKNIFVDPVFNGSASPFRFMVKSFPGSDVYSVGDMPEIDYLVLTHDHYDHLDYRTVLLLKDKTKEIICSAGVGSHLEYWGFKNKMIFELD